MHLELERYRAEEKEVKLLADLTNDEKGATSEDEKDCSCLRIMNSKMLLLIDLVERSQNEVCCSYLNSIYLNLSCST